MLACETLLPLDARASYVGRPCALCLCPVENGVCIVCGTSADDDFAAVYAVTTIDRPYYIGRSLRRAWEAQGYLHNVGLDSASITVPARLRPDHDGLTSAEAALLDAWDIDFTRVHTCIAPTKVGLSG